MAAARAPRRRSASRSPCGATPPAATSRSWSRCRATACRRELRIRAAGAARRALRRRVGRVPPRARRRRGGAALLPPARAGGGRARGAARRARAGGRAARPHVGRPARRRAGRALTATPRAAASPALLRPRCPTTTRPRRSPELALQRHRAARARCAAGEEFAVGLQNERRRAHAGGRAAADAGDASPTHGGKIPLGELLPVLEALGLTVMEEVPTRLDGGDDGAYLHDFGVLVDDAQLDCERDGERLARGHHGGLERARRVRHAQRAWSSARDCAWRRRGRSCAPTAATARIVAPTFTAAYQNDVLVRPSEDGAAARRAVPRALLRRAATRRARPSCARDSTSSIAAVGSLDEDRILRGFLGADRRHGAHERRTRRATTCRFKLRSADVPQMPRPRAALRDLRLPARRSRASTCAAGTSRAAASAGPTGARTTAPRCSGLMKAQMVKNAVIVPGRRRRAASCCATPPERARRAARGGAAAATRR